MPRKFIFGQEKNRISKGIVAGTMAGGVFGAIGGILYKTNVSAAPEIGHTFKDSSVNVIIIGAVLGIFIGAGISSLIRLYITRDKAFKHDSYLNNSKLQLREEQLDISKRWVKTGEVTMHKEVLKEEKNIVVPVTREELVIEKKVLDKEALNKNNERTETIRVPISEERIEIIKHPVDLEDLAIYRRQLQETEQIEEVLKKEKLRIKTKKL